MNADQRTPPAAVSFAKSRASVALDGLRGLAALLVLTDHWRHFFFLELSNLPAHRALLLLPYIASVAGHQAVIIFFVLSGFLVGGSVMRAVERKGWSWRQYLLHRLVRLWIVLLPALLLGAFWDRLTLIRVLRNPVQYADFLSTALAGDLRSSLNLPDFLANAAFLQTLRLPGSSHIIPTFGSNTALWSLSAEFWYYILFPCVLFALLRTYRAGQRVLCLALFVVLALFVGKTIMVLFPVWLGGVLLLYLPQLRLGTTVRVVAATVYAGAFLGCVALSRFASASDAVLAVCTVAFLWVLLSGSSVAARPGPAQTAVRGLARFSYTLYLVHKPLLYFIGTLLVRGTRWVPSVATLSIAVAVWLFILGYAWCIASLTEFHNDAVRRWLEMRLPWLTGSRRGPAQATQRPA